MANGDTKTNQYLDVAANGSRADLPSDTCCETRTQTLIRGVAERIMDVEDEVERLENSPDVVDIVATYADLQDYDTSGLTDKDIIRVLADETHGGNSAYYRWDSAASQFEFIGEIAGGDSIIELTVGDYNYPTNNPDGIAPWLLDEGIYTTASGVQVYRDRNTSTTSPVTFIYSNGSLLWMEGGNTDTGIRYSYLSSSGSEFSAASGFLLKSSNVRDNLTSTSTTNPLSANQGKVLKDMIDAIPTGGVTELTTADYDYPAGSPDRVALWRLPSGVYTAKSGVQTASSTTRAASYGGMLFVSQLSANVGDNALVLANYGGTGNQNTKLEYDYTYSDGTAWPNQSGISFIDSREVVDNLTSTRTDYVLSANQGKVLKDMIDNLPTGGAIELTSADFNYDYGSTGSFNKVALWLLPPGEYYTNTLKVSGILSSTQILSSTSTQFDNQQQMRAFNVIKVPAADGVDYVEIEGYRRLSSDSAGTPVIGLMRVRADGTFDYKTALLDQDMVAQTTGTSTTNVMSQKAVTDAIAAIPTGGVTELTSADYNWPTSNPTSVALWLLEPGVYTWNNGVNVQLNTDNRAKKGISIVSSPENDKVSILNIPAKDEVMWFSTVTQSNGQQTRQFSIEGAVDYLTDTSGTAPLAANQGRVLKGLIGDLTNLTTTDKTNLVAAINEAAAGGGGGAKALTSAMANYPDNNPTDIALWKLEPGFYYRTGAQTPIIRSSTNKQVSNCIGVLVCKSSGNTYMYCLPGYGTTQIECYVTATSNGFAKTVYNGNSVGMLAYTYMLTPITGSGTPTTSTSASVGKIYIDTDTDTAYICTKASGGVYTWEALGGGGGGPTVVQTTGTSTTNVMSQKAVTDAIAAIPTGGVTELTSADYNWPTSNPTSVALWLLDNGMYVAESDSVNVSITYNKTGLGNGVALVKQLDNENPSRANVIVLKDDSSAIYYGMTADGRNASQYNLYTAVAQATGTSTIDAMSQNATTSMVYADPRSMAKVRIGGGTVSFLTNYCVAIGLNASVNGEYGISIGPQASAVWQGSIALGAFSGGAGNLTSPGMIHVGSSNTDHGYNNSNYRLLTGLYDGQNDHDAVTVSQVNSVIDNLNSALNTNIPHIGA